MPKSWAFRTAPPSYRPRIVTPYPDTRPEPTLHRLSGGGRHPVRRFGAGTQGARLPPQPSSPRHSPSPQPLTGHPLQPSFRCGAWNRTQTSSSPTPPSVIPDPDPEPRGARLPPNRRPSATLRRPHSPSPHCHPEPPYFHPDPLSCHPAHPHCHPEPPNMSS